MAIRNKMSNAHWKIKRRALIASATSWLFGASWVHSPLLENTNMDENINTNTNTNIITNTNTCHKNKLGFWTQLDPLYSAGIGSHLWKYIWKQMWATAFYFALWEMIPVTHRGLKRGWLFPTKVFVHLSAASKSSWRLSAPSSSFLRNLSNNSTQSVSSLES